jgi:hypothetical protein
MCAKRPTAMSPFANADPLTGLNTAADEDDPWISPDGQVLMFTRRVGATYAIFESLRK